MHIKDMHVSKMVIGKKVIRHSKTSNSDTSIIGSSAILFLTGNLFRLNLPTAARYASIEIIICNLW